MTVSAQSSERGQVNAEIPVQPESIPGRVALNVKYLLDYLEGKEGVVTLGKDEGSSPALFHYGSKPIVAVMPMKVQWEDEQAADGEPSTEAAKGTAETTEENPEREIEDEAIEDPENEEPDAEQPVPENIGQDGAIAVNQEEVSPQESAPEPVTAGVTAGVTSTENPPEPETTGTPKKRRGRRKKT